MSEIIKQMVYFSSEEAQTITVGQVIENHMVPKFPKAQYTTDNTGKPCIVLPCIDGNYRNDFNPVLVFDVDPTKLLSNASSSVTTRVGFIDMNTKGAYHYNFGYRVRNIGSTSDSYNSGNYTSIDFKNTIHWWEYTYDNIRSLGIASSNSNYSISMLSMDIMITKCKTLDTDEEVDVLMVAGGERMNNIYLIYPYKGRIVKTTIPRWTLPEVEKTINVYQCNDGNIYNDKLYVCFPMSHTLLKPLARFDSRYQPVHSDTWNKEAFTIGGKKFDLKLTSASEGEYVSIAKLSQ